MIILAVLFIGAAYEGIKAGANLAKGRPANFNVTVALNPLAAVGQVVRDTVSGVSDQRRGIWIGRQSLGDYGVGVQFYPGLDVHHMVVVIDGACWFFYFH
ncbi:hypothetical protein HDU98_001649 [Podochytrium sp. JEL0797]|nr:hypothetical protein HDU98_001649 [Podochytrium sp. JEL0797]